MPVLTEAKELDIVSRLLEELNQRFALQLDPKPCTARFGSASDREPRESRPTIVLAGASHIGNLMEPLSSSNVNVVDLSIPGFRITEAAVESMVTDLEGAISGLDDKNTVVVLQVFDNSIYFSSKARGEKVLTRKGKDKKFHVDGELKLVTKEDLKSLFIEIMPLIRAAKGKHIIIMTPLPRYVFSKCCLSSVHVTNFGRVDYMEELLGSLRDIHGWINSSVFMRRLKNIKIFNSTSALGFQDPLVSEAQLLDLWGNDPVHLSQEAYYQLAGKLYKMADDVIAAGSQKDGQVVSTKGKRPLERESWIAGSEPVAKRQNIGFNYQHLEQGSGYQLRGGRGRHHSRGHNSGGRAGSYRGGSSYQIGFGSNSGYYQGGTESRRNDNKGYGRGNGGGGVDRGRGGPGAARGCYDQGRPFMGHRGGRWGKCQEGKKEIKKVHKSLREKYIQPFNLSMS